MNTAHTAPALEVPPGPTIEQFEALDFEVASFDHEAHVFVAWSYLQNCDLLEAIRRYRQTLVRLTTRLGIPDKYHETITWFYMVAVAEAAVDDAATDWSFFKARNPALFRRSPSIVRDFYSEDRLMSAKARSLFVLPDLA